MTRRGKGEREVSSRGADDVGTEIMLDRDAELFRGSTLQEQLLAGGVAQPRQAGIDQGTVDLWNTMRLYQSGRVCQVFSLNLDAERHELCHQCCHWCNLITAS